jgi:hypothetical protein
MPWHREAPLAQRGQSAAQQPFVGYLFTDAEGEPYNALGHTKHVWIAGRCRLVEDPEDIQAFFQRRAAATGQGDAHPKGGVSSNPLATNV